MNIEEREESWRATELDKANKYWLSQGIRPNRFAEIHKMDTPSANYVQRVYSEHLLQTNSDVYRI